MPRLILIRGNVGSGKSTLAKTYDAFHLEADKFFIRNGNYDWSSSKIKLAHNLVKELAERIMSASADLTISNTFTQLWEMQPYIDLAEEYNYTIKIIRCENKFKTIHNVPDDVINKMQNRFEDYEGEEIYK